VKYTALVPVKSLKEAKSRLAAHLTPEQRAALMLDMLHHVLSVLQESAVFAHVSVVSADKHVLTQAQAWGAQPLVEERAGHNPALTAAASRELMDGADALLTISADLPLLQPHDIREFVKRSQNNDIVLAPSQDRTGTNALLARPPLVLPYVFGVNSLPHYQAEAEKRNLSYNFYSTLGLALDIDTIEDIAALQQHENPEKKEWVHQYIRHELADRLLASNNGD
jgi:2-phospho-L-lactate/phosphoenolpyruvate guanylyltransferase